jgi:hypothetical protein
MVFCFTLFVQLIMLRSGEMEIESAGTETGTGHHVTK